jgi:hypothetical protein
MAFPRNLVTRVGTSVVACLALTLSAATTAQAQTVSTGSLDLAAADGGVQQFFSAAVAEEMSVTVSATEGKIAVTTRDANNNVVQLGFAEPNDPLTVQGTYDDLYASIADPQGDPPKGGYSITFNEGLARAEAGDRSAPAMIPENQAPTSPSARPATATPGASQPVPPVKAFNLTQNDSQQIFQGDGTECTTISINNAGGGVVLVSPTYVGDNGPRPGIPVGPGNSTTIRCNLVAVTVATGNASASGNYTIDG